MLRKFMTDNLSNNSRLANEKHAQEVLAWRNYLTTATDEEFFNLIHIYLGEVKTPYNKQKLIEQLSSFLRNEEHKKTILSLLSKKDIIILSAIYFMPNPTIKDLNKFFKDDFSNYQIFDAISNFKERLLVFTVSKDNEQKHKEEILKINPLLKSSLEPCFSLKNLVLYGYNDLSESDETEIFSSSSFKLTPMFVAAMYSFVKTFDSVLKNDGSFKKKIASSLQDLFPSTEFESGNPEANSVSFFIQTAKNLSLFLQTENDIIVNKERWLQFAKLPFFSQAIHIAVASQGRFTNLVQNRYAEELLFLIQLLKDLDLQNIYQNEKILTHLLYLVEQKMNEINTNNPHRLSRIVSEIAENPQENEIPVFASIVRTAKNYGLLSLEVIEESDLSGSPVVQESAKFYPRLTIDANFSVVVLDFYSLYDLIPVLDLCTFKSYDSVIQLEITKKSCLKAFDLGYKLEEIKNLLEKYTIHELPQNLIFSLDEWYEQFQSCKVYQGIIVQLDKTKQAIFEHNPEFSRHIAKIFQPGLYLLDFKTCDEFNEEIEKAQKSGLDFINPIENKMTLPNLVPLREIKENPDLVFEKTTGGENCVGSQVVLAENHIAHMEEYLSSLEATSEQKQSLSERIIRKTILTKEQLKVESVRFEKTESFGMDYAGKIHIIENAIVSNSFIEICYGSDFLEDAKLSENGIKSFVLLPLELERTATETYLKATYNSKQIELPVGTSISVKRVLKKGWDS